MAITSPAEFLKDLDVEFFKRYRPLPDATSSEVEYVQPELSSRSEQPKKPEAAILSAGNSVGQPLRELDKISSKVVTLGDFIDTDAVSLCLT